MFDAKCICSLSISCIVARCPNSTDVVLWKMTMKSAQNRINQRERNKRRHDGVKKRKKIMLPKRYSMYLGISILTYVVGIVFISTNRSMYLFSSLKFDGEEGSIKLAS